MDEMGLSSRLLSRGQLEYLLAKNRLPHEFERLAKEYKAVRELVAAALAEATSGWPEVQGRCLLCEACLRRKNPAGNHHSESVVRHLPHSHPAVDLDP